MDNKTYIGIDIGSTASKVCILEPGKAPQYEVLPTGWNSKITANNIRENLEKKLGEKVGSGYRGYNRWAK